MLNVDLNQYLSEKYDISSLEDEMYLTDYNVEKYFVDLEDTSEYKSDEMKCEVEVNNSNSEGVYGGVECLLGNIGDKRLLECYTEN